MRAESPLERYVQTALYAERRKAPFSSIAMANLNVEQVDDIDVISDAEVSPSKMASINEGIKRARAIIISWCANKMGTRKKSPRLESDLGFFSAKN